MMRQKARRLDQCWYPHAGDADGAVLAVLALLLVLVVVLSLPLPP